MNLKRNKGITLITLVVTIVLLILAGVSIATLTGNNGILTQANKARENTKRAEDIEKIEIAILGVQMGENGYQKLDIDTLQEELDKIFEDGILKVYDNNTDEFIFYTKDNIYKISSNEVTEIDLGNAIYQKQENRNIQGEYEYAYNNPIIPKGFIPLETKDASWVTNEEGLPMGWNNGLVIMDESGNEFVWIPCITQDLDTSENVVKYGCYAQNDKFTAYQVDINSLQDLQKYIPVENEFSQIEKYQGFYVGRYETAMSENIPRVSNVDIDDSPDVVNINKIEPIYNGITVKPVIQQGKEVWNYVSRDNAAEISRKIVNNENVKSGLITGKQWDTMLEWIITGGTYDNSSNADKYYSEIGNFYNSQYTINGLYAIQDKNDIANWHKGQYTKTINEFICLGTGVHNNSKVNNIFDIYGNLWEFTTETDANGKVIQRGIGANAGSNKAAGVHRHGNTDTSGIMMGFRIVLYIA